MTTIREIIEEKGIDRIKSEIELQCLLNQAKFLRSLLDCKTNKEKILICEKEIKRLNMIPDFSNNEVVMVCRDCFKKDCICESIKESEQ